MFLDKKLQDDIKKLHSIVLELGLIYPELFSSRWDSNEDPEVYGWELIDPQEPDNINDEELDMLFEGLLFDSSFF